MKFKRLPKEELKKLEKEFINFLAVNSITADDWIKLQEQSHEQMNILIDEFSDMVYHRIMEKISYLDYRSKSELKVFHADKESITLIGLTSSSEEIDFTNENQLTSIFNGNNLKDLQVYKTEKKYNKEREVELFEMMEHGCCIVDPSVFHFLAKINDNA